MLAATEACTDTGVLPHHFGNETVDIVGPREVVPVTAVIREDDVALSIEASGECDRRQFLADAGVGRASELARGKQAQQFLFDRANQASLIEFTAVLHGSVEFAVNALQHDG